MINQMKVERGNQSLVKEDGPGQILRNVSFAKKVADIMVVQMQVSQNTEGGLSQILKVKYHDKNNDKNQNTTVELVSM